MQVTVNVPEKRLIQALQCINIDVVEVDVIEQMPSPSDETRDGKEKRITSTLIGEDITLEALAQKLAQYYVNNELYTLGHMTVLNALDR